MGDIHGLPLSRLTIIPATTHIGMMQRTDWLIPMIIDFLDSDLDAAPPTKLLGGAYTTDLPSFIYLFVALRINRGEF